jgi:hypothetical protein
MATMRLIKAGETTAARKRVYFDLRDAVDGITPETGEGSGQPQISVDGAAWTNTGIGTLTHIGLGRYYADLTDAAVQADQVGKVILTRYDSANTVETPGTSVQVVAFDPVDTFAITEPTGPIDLTDMTMHEVLGMLACLHIGNYEMEKLSASTGIVRISNSSTVITTMDVSDDGTTMTRNENA